MPRNAGLAELAPPTPRACKMEGGAPRRLMPRNGKKGIRAANSSGLTLIELISSFAILAIIIGTLAVALNATTENWHTAQSRTRTMAQARAVLDTIAQDFRQAVATTNFNITVGTDPTVTNSAANNYIQFLRLTSAASTNQYAVTAIRYSLTNYTGSSFRLVRWSQPLNVGVLPGVWDDDNLVWPVQTPLTDGVAAFHINYAVSTTGGLVPPYFDIYLELLDADDARAAASLTVNQTQFVERHVMRFSQRIFLPAVNRWNL